MILGLIIIRMYNVWEFNVWLLVTLIGWIAFIKGAFYMLMPEVVIKSSLAMKNNLALMYVGGVVALVMGAVLGYHAYFV